MSGSLKTVQKVFYLRQPLGNSPFKISSATIDNTALSEETLLKLVPSVLYSEKSGGHHRIISLIIISKHAGYEADLC